MMKSMQRIKGEHLVDIALDDEKESETVRSLKNIGNPVVVDVFQDKEKEAGQTPKQPVRKNLDVITGIRFGATLWIVLEHFANNKDVLKNITYRGEVPVSFYIIVSGFVTHYAYGTRITAAWNTVMKYLFKRFTRCFPAYYIALVFCFVYQKWINPGNLVSITTATNVTSVDAFAPSAGDKNATFVSLLPELTWTQSWFPMIMGANPSHNSNFAWNFPDWTMSTLGFSWILYPLLAWLVSKATKKGGLPASLWMLLTFTVGAAMPYLVGFLIKDDNHAYDPNWITGWYWRWRIFPPARFMDFAAGVMLAETLRVNGGRGAKGINSWAGWRYLSDLGVLSIFLLLFFRSLYTVQVHNAGTDADDLVDIGPRRESYEMLFENGLLPLVMLVLYSTCALETWPEGWLSGGVFARVFSSEPLKSLGRNTFIIYIFQLPVYYVVELLTGDGNLNRAQWMLGPSDMVFFLVILWTGAFIFDRFVEAPFSRLCVRGFEAVAGKPKSGSCTKPKQIQPAHLESSGMSFLQKSLCWVALFLILALQVTVAVMMQTAPSSRVMEMPASAHPVYE